MYEMAYLRLMIKKLFLFLCIVAYASVAVRAGEPALGESTSQTPAPSGVEFGSGSLEQMLGQAGDEQRLLLVELYATWCRPCRIMERTFADSSVGDYVNDNFVAVRYDVDQYEGGRVSQIYGISSIPTCLLLDSEGNLVGKLVGAVTPTAFVQNMQRLVANIKK